MRNLVLAAALVCSAPFVGAADPVEIRAAVRLDTAEEMQNLRATNPDHYARARRVIAAANVLCRPAPPGLQGAGRGRRGGSCGHLFLTSNPPKREITFRLDNTRYAALVTVTADPPKAASIE